MSMEKQEMAGGGLAGNDGPAVDVIIPTYHPDKSFPVLIERLLKQSYPIRKIIIMNTEESLWISTGMERLLGKTEQLEIHHIKKSQFDHGKTRDQAIHYSETEIFICMTQDAMPRKNSLVAKMVAALQDEETALAYARQMPAENCDLIEQYTRDFNYPDRDIIKTKGDLPRMGIKTYFASNVCAAYKRSVYHELGGFTQKTIFNEDMIFAAKAINHHYKIAYCSEAQVIHSHNYTCIQQFKRNFDLAVSQADHPEVFTGIKSEKEGLRMIRQTASGLSKAGKISHLPRLVAVSGFKWAGYQLGKRYQKLPGWMIRTCTMNCGYWKQEETS